MGIFREHPPLWLVNLVSFLSCIVLLFAFVYVSYNQYLTGLIQARIELARALPSPQTLKENPFDGVRLAARAVVVYNVSRKEILYSYNETTQLPLASLTKLMTAVVASETLPAYTGIEVIQQEKNGDVNLKTGERWTLSDILTYTLLTSSNTGANSIAAAATAYFRGRGTTFLDSYNAYADFSPFVEAMNRKAEELQLTNTYFLNASGLDMNEQVSGAYGSAQDVAKLISYILETNQKLFTATDQLEKDFTAPDGRVVTANNTNEHVLGIPGLIGSKTGLTDLAKGNLAIAFDASFGEPFVVVVLGSTEIERFNDAHKLIQATIDYLGVGMKAPRSEIDNSISLLNNLSNTKTQ